MTKDVEIAAGSAPRKSRCLRFLQFHLRTWLLAMLFLAPWCLLARHYFPSECLLEGRLKRPVEVRFDKTPLQEVLDDLAKQADIAIQFSPIQAAAVGADASTPVTLNLCDPIPLRTALFLMLRPLGLEQVPSDQDGLSVVAIGLTGYDAREFEVADLVGSDADFDQLLLMIRSTIDPQSWSDGSLRRPHTTPHRFSPQKSLR